METELDCNQLGMMPMDLEKPPVCDYEDSDYQASFWDQGDRQYEDEVEAVALRRMLPSHGRLLLEVGAGAGRNTPRYAGFQRIVLLDYSLSQLRLARARLGASDSFIYVAADAYRLPFVPGLFDAATMIRVLHHMAEPAQVLAGIHQVLERGAVFVLEYANKHNLKAIIRYLARRQPWSPFSPEPVEFAALNFDFHPRSVRTWLTTAGFKIQRQLTVSHYRIAVLKRTLPLNLLVKMDSLVQFTGDFWQLTPSVFVRSAALGDQRAAAGSFFRCPECKYLPLTQEGDFLPCPGCGRAWPVKDGIYDFTGKIA